MSRDADAKADPKTVRLYDKRIVERNIKKGLLSRKDYEKHLKALDDIADKGVYGGPLEDDDVDDREDLDEGLDDADTDAGGDLAAQGAASAPDDEPDDDETAEDDDTDEPEAPEGNSHGT